MNNNDLIRTDPEGLDVKAAPVSTHWQLVRALIAFQFKLAMDGLRDVLLSPVSLIAALAGILSSRQDPARYFNRLLELGHRSDRWINLFNTWDNSDDSSPSADTFIRHAESIVLNELKKGANAGNRADGMTERPFDEPNASDAQAWKNRPEA